MNRQRPMRIVAVLLAGIVLFLLFLYLFLPMDRVTAALDGVLSQQGVRLTPAPRKSFLPGINWDQPTLSSDQGALLRADRLAVAPAWGSLLSGSLALSTAMQVKNGTLDLLTGVTGRTAFKLAINKLSLADIPFFTTVLGARAGGLLWSEGVINRTKTGLNGELKLEVQKLELSGVKLGAFPLPDVSGLTAQGMVRVADGKGKLESLTLQGEGIYMRLSGNLPSGANAATAPLDLMLEIMPKPEFLEKQKLVFMLLIKFMSSPGVYRIPVRGTLLKPVII